MDRRTRGGLPRWLRDLGYYGRIFGRGRRAGGEGGPAGVPQRDAFLVLFAAACAAFAFMLDAPRAIWEGSLRILFSPANLLTDYVALGGAGAAWLNVAVMSLSSVLLIRRTRAPVSGPVVAAFFTVAGFSLFGKNLFNSVPIVLGVFLYAKAARQPMERLILHCLLGTTLGPLVSEFAFGIGLPYFIGVPAGVLAGAAAGFALAPLSVHFMRFHHGFSLYNIGFTAGIVAMLFAAALRAFGVDLRTVAILSAGNNAVFAPALMALCAAMLGLGLWLARGRMAQYLKLMKLPGTLPTDFVAACGAGVTLVNMGLMGLLSVGYVLLMRGELSGPVMGGVLTVVGFSAMGKHPRNSIPVVAGVFLAGLATGQTGTPLALLAALFGTTLAPLSGTYGVAAGVAAGAVHMFLVAGVGFLHAGMNLYNNGFSGGFVAAALYPLLEALRGMAAARRQGGEAAP
ncbi:MAG TPA: DUF1576 domain-containing protein [Candidatus Limnocylindria bacterium]|nr:DUF1576 domain-containing protein [Candidatus Limnocylindria bacterium]